VKGEPVEERRRRALVVREALVEGDHARPGRQGQAEAVALQAHLAVVERGGKAGGGERGDALGHGEEHDPAVRLREKPALRDRPPPPAASREGRARR
jgi:hypothetical protein